jgi:hypothetical protein
METPTFVDWAVAGLIVERLAQRWKYPVVRAVAGEKWCCEVVGEILAIETTGPLAVRAAALAYIRATE